MNIDEILAEAKKHYLFVRETYIKQCKEQGLDWNESLIWVARPEKTEMKESRRNNCNYKWLEAHLKNTPQAKETLELSFNEIANICGSQKLPQIAYDPRKTYWANGQPIPKSCKRAGWFVKAQDVNLTTSSVVFHREEREEQTNDFGRTH